MYKGLKLTDSDPPPFGRGRGRVSATNLRDRLGCVALQVTVWRDADAGSQETPSPCPLPEGGGSDAATGRGFLPEA